MTQLKADDPAFDDINLGVGDSAAPVMFAANSGDNTGANDTDTGGDSGGGDVTTYTTSLVKNGVSLESIPAPTPWETYVEPFVEGDVYTVVGSISVDHDMDGGASTPDIILNQDNNFYFSDLLCRVRCLLKIF